jgi:ABC-type phosphate transport system substrate-binding protein
MKTRRTTKKLITLLLMLTMLLSLVACSTKHEAVVPDKDPAKTVVDEVYTGDIEKEKGVDAAQVTVQDGIAVATMLLNDEISDADAKKLAEKYAAQLKETYKDMKINVQAVKSGKNIANILLEK